MREGISQLHVNATTPVSDTPTAVTATTTVVTVTVPNTLSIGELVTIAGVTANGTNCSAADAAAINGPQIPVTASTTQLTFDATIPTRDYGRRVHCDRRNCHPGIRTSSHPRWWM